MDKRIIFWSVLFLLSACASQKPMQNQDDPYREDLSAYRPKVEGTETSNGPAVTEAPRKVTQNVPPKMTVNQQVNSVLDSIDRTHLARKYYDGFTIQIFSGEKEKAMNIKRQVSMALPTLDSELTFDAPTFRVKIGRYVSRMDAQPDFMTVKKQFPSAIVVPVRIPLP